MSKLISIFFVCVCFSPVPDDQMQSTSHCKLSIEFTNIRNTKGVLYIFMYNYENQYPDNPFRHYAIDKKNIRSKRLLVNIPDLEPGKYGISIFDDENSNEDMDFFLGLPTEGFAFSNNVRPLLSLPEFEDIVVDMNKSHEKMRLKMKYVL